MSFTMHLNKCCVQLCVCFLFHRYSETYIYLLYLYVHYLNHDLYLRNNL